MSEHQTPAPAETARQAPQGKLTVLGLSALGIVFGDIGTSPLYTFKTILGTAGKSPGRPSWCSARFRSGALDALSSSTAVKYVLFAMRVDNDGEGGDSGPDGLAGREE